MEYSGSVIALSQKKDVGVIITPVDSREGDYVEKEAL